MKRLFFLTLIVPLSFCAHVNVPPTSERAICQGLASLVDAHQDGLLVDAGPVSLTTGASLIAGYDAACFEDAAMQ